VSLFVRGEPWGLGKRKENKNYSMKIGVHQVTGPEKKVHKEGKGKEEKYLKRVSRTSRRRGKKKL